MPLESASYINTLDATNPAPTDLLSQADDHIRLIKSALKATFPNLTGPVTVSQNTINAPFGLAVGSIIMWYGDASSCPVGWAICNGQTVSLSSGSGIITTPNLQDRVPIGVGNFAPSVGSTLGSTISSGSTSTAGSHVHGITGGSHTHTGQVTGTSLTVGQIPAHYHYEFTTNNGDYGSLPSNPEGSPNVAGAGGSSGASYYIGSNSSLSATIGRSSTVGGGQAHSHGLLLDATAHSHDCATEGSHSHTLSVSTMQPALGVHFIMKI